MNRSFVSHGARRCGEIGTIVRRKKSCDGRRTHATHARVETLWLEELRGASERLRDAQTQREILQLEEL